MTGDQKWLFIESLRETPNVSEAARVAGVCRKTAYNERAADREFKELWDHAIGSSVDRLEAAAFSRATDCWVASRSYHKGELVGETYKVSDGLVPLLLKAHKPEIYSQPEKHEIAGKDGGPAVVMYLPTNGRESQPEED